MADNFLTLLPMIAVDADEVRARFNADATAGIDPSDPDYVDTTTGGPFWDLTQPAVLECVRIYDLIGTEFISAVFPATAWGDFLDLHGETVRLPRDDEVHATGTALFSGVIGTLIPAATQVATVQADPSAVEAPVTFTTDRSITLAATPGPTNLAATPSGAGGTIPAGTYYYRVTAVGATGETIASNEVTVTLSGATSSVALAWTALAGATAYRIYRGTALEAEVLLASPGGTGTSYTDTGAAVPGTSVVPTNSVGVTAAEAGSAGNVGAGTISQVLSPIQSAPSVTNLAAASGGADVESDDRYRTRVMAEFGKPGGAGNISDYVKWALQVPQVGFVTVQPIWAGAGTVRVIVTDRSNHPVSASIVAQLQTSLDPVAQQGRGQAPVGAIVTVATPTSLTVNVVGTPTFQSGYSLDGAGGAIPLRTTIQAAVTSYLNSLSPGQTVVLNAVIRQIMSVPGVADVSGVTLNGSAGNVTVAALQVATAGTVNLT